MHQAQAVKVLFSHFVEWCGAVDARVVDQKIEGLSLPFRFEGPLDGLAEFREQVNIRDVNLEKRRLASELFNFSGNSFAFLFALPIRKNHVCAISGEGKSDVATKATAAAGDHGDFITDIHGWVFLLVKSSFVSMP